MAQSCACATFCFLHLKACLTQYVQSSHDPIVDFDDHGKKDLDDAVVEITKEAIHIQIEKIIAVASYLSLVR